MGDNSMDQLPYGLRCELLDAFGTWVTDYMDQGDQAYLTTFMFNYIPGNSKSIIGSMTKDRSPPDRRKPLAAHGRTIHSGHVGLQKMSARSIDSAKGNAPTLRSGRCFK